MSNTDVAHSIAGYYYQLLLACSEVVKLLNNKTSNDDDWVAVEKDSDIKIHTNSGFELAIESKFYKNDGSFTRNHPTIKHTIYNFYNDFTKRRSSGATLCKYRYSTNVKVSNKNSDNIFFDQWNNQNVQEWNNYITYIRECLVYECINHSPLYKENFQNYKVKVKQNTQDYPEDKNIGKWYELLITDIQDGIENYNDYCNFDETLVIEFIKVIEFDFGRSNNYRIYDVERLSREIEDNLGSYFKGLHKEFYSNIRNYLIEYLFKSTIGRGEKYNYDYKLKVFDVKKMIEKPQEVTSDIISNYISKKQLERIHDEIAALQRKTRNYDADKAEKIFLKFIEISSAFTNIHTNIKTDFEAFISEYSLDKSYAYSIIPNLCRIMAVLSVYENIDTNNINLTSNKGLNNFSFTDKYRFSLKATDVVTEDKTEYLIEKFIYKTINSMKCPMGDEAIVLYSPNLDSEFTPCKYEKEEIENLINNTITSITQTSNNLKIQELYKTMNYRCSKCIDLLGNPIEREEKIKNFTIRRCADFNA